MEIYVCMSICVCVCVCVYDLKCIVGGTSLVVQWLRLHAPNAGGLRSIPGQGTRSRKPQLRPSAAK